MSWGWSRNLRGEFALGHTSTLVPKTTTATALSPDQYVSCDLGYVRRGWVRFTPSFTSESSVNNTVGAFDIVINGAPLPALPPGIIAYPKADLSVATSGKVQIFWPGATMAIDVIIWRELGSGIVTFSSTTILIERVQAPNT